METLKNGFFTTWLPSTSSASINLILQTTIITAITFVVWNIAVMIRNKIKWSKVFSHLPGPPENHWMYGSFVNFPKSPHERLEKFIYWTKTYSKKTGYIRLWGAFGKPFIMVCHPETMKRILKTAEPKSKNMSSGYRLLMPWLGDGLLIAGGEKWARNRRLLTPAFHFDILKPYIDVYNTSANKLVPKPKDWSGGYKLLMPWLGEGLLIAGGERWARNRRLLTPAFHFDILKPYLEVYNNSADKLVKNINEFAGKREKFEAFQYVCMCTLDIILRCAFSYDIDVQQAGQTHPYVTAVNNLATTVVHRTRNPWLLMDWLFYLTSVGKQFKKDCDFVHAVAEDIIEKRQQTLKNGVTNTGRKYLDFVDILLTARDESGNGLSKLDIRNEVDTFLFEGHDTTASAISWILYSLAEHPEYQQKCQQEIDEVLEGRETDDLEWSDLSKLEYLTMCIKEGMRLHCPVAMIGRTTTKDFDIGDRVLPKGTGISINIWALHHNENVWENHMEYIPERFSKENTAKMDNYQFVPFAAGPRNCIGQHFALNEEKVVLSKLLYNFTFKLDTSHVVRRRLAAVMRSENGMYMYAERRKH